MNFKPVTKDEFNAFLEANAQRLVRTTITMGEPPIAVYMDTTAGAYPESIVAKCLLYDGSAYHGGKSPEYFIRADQVGG